MLLNHMRVGMAALLIAGLCPAATIFQDGFESNNVASNATLNGWTNVRPSVDILPNSGSFNCVEGNRCVDLDGTSGSAGFIETATNFTFTNGLTYTLSFWLSQNQRGFGGPDQVTACVGSACSTYNLATSAPGSNTWAQYTIILAGDGSTGKISFNHGGGDNVGILLDDVSLADNTVPEPGTFVLIGSALAFFGLRRRS